MDCVSHCEYVLPVGKIRVGDSVRTPGFFPLEVKPMGNRFFERIAKTYRREKWNAILRPLFPTWYACAKKLGDVELTVKLLVEMIGYGAWMSDFTFDC